MEMMGKTETKRDRDQTNMVRLWIEPLDFIAVVCRVYVWDLCPPRSMENERRETERDIRDQEQQKEKCDMRGRQARR